MKDLYAQALTTDTIWGEFAILPLIYRDIIHSVLSFAEPRGFLPLTAKIVTSPNNFKIAKISLFKENNTFLCFPHALFANCYVDYELFVDPDDPNSDGVQIISKGTIMPNPRSTDSSSIFVISELDKTCVTIHPTDHDILDKLNLIFK